jgi:hypothetical protein
LVLFACTTFVMLAVAALAIDAGFARLTQRQMQTAVDAAALEGLRFRDASASNPDSTRRMRAARIASLAFDADMNLADDDQESQLFGAGPTIAFGGSVGDPSLAASQYMQSSALGVYKPSLQTNDANAQEGDMVAGSYVNQGPGFENADYSRSDFSLPDASTGQTSGAAPAFLVRMRRTLNAQNPDAQQLDDNPGISSAGPTVPFLFGRGSIMARSSANANDLTIQSGITVRATAIADARPALTVGPAYPDATFPLADGSSPPIAGAAPFALQLSEWNGSLASATQTYKLDASGNLAPLSGGAAVGQITAISSLASDLSAGATAVSVDNWPGFPVGPPASPAFAILVDRELMLVTGSTTGSGGTLTWQVERGKSGTSPVQHPAQTPVVLHNARGVGEAVQPQALAPPPPLPPLDNLAVLNPLANDPPPIPAYTPLYSGSIGVGFGAVDWSAGRSSNGSQLQITLTAHPAKVAAENASAALTVPVSPAAAIQLQSQPSAGASGLLAPALVNY